VRLFVLDRMRTKGALMKLCPRRLRLAVFIVVVVWVAQTTHAEYKSPSAVLFENVRIFSGDAKRLSEPSNVLVVDNKISAISRQLIAPPDGARVTRIEGNGRALIPGLIDAHTHIMFATIPAQTLLTSDIGYINVAAVKAAQEMLMRGFTTIRDMGGPVFGLKRGIDTGLVPGPRIWPSGAMISQSGGHGDFRLPNEMPAPPGSFSFSERVGASMIADSPDEVRKRVREQLALGASQVKLMAGGGASSTYDPLDVTEYSPSEMRAAVEAAENWRTYVTVHAYTARAVRQSAEAGVKCIEHGQLIDAATAKEMRRKGIWWSLQPFTTDRPTAFPEGSPQRIKQEQVANGTDQAYALAKRYNIKTAWGTDILFSPEIAAMQGSRLAVMARWYTPAEALKMATADNAKLLALSGPRSPYQGKLGVVEVGALADLILVDGNPLEDITLVSDPETNFVVIMKDGKVYKNTLP